MGPLLITTPNPPARYNASAKLAQSTVPISIQNLTPSGQAAPGTGVPIPAMGTADWLWLQPYSVSEDDGKGKDVKVQKTEWNALGIEPLDNKEKLEGGPYTAVEGYLQLRTPLGGEGLKPPS
jgi:hypothetical protein